MPGYAKTVFFPHRLTCILTFLCIADLVLVKFILLLGGISFETLKNYSECLQMQEVNTALVCVWIAVM